MKGCLLVAAVVLAIAGCTPNLYDVRTERTMFLETHKADTVYLSIQNTSSVQDFPLLDDIRNDLQAKGYRIVENPDDADIQLRANVLYSGLMEDAFGGGRVAGGAAAGGVGGGLLGAAAGGRTRGVIASGLIGALIGAGLGAWAEEENRKNTFTTVVDLQIKQKGGRAEQTKVFGRIREHGLTADSAARRMAPDIAKQIAGQFPAF